MGNTVIKMKRCYKFLYSKLVAHTVFNQVRISPNPKQHFKYTFDSFTLDTRRGALLRLGVEIPIRAQSFQVLTYLLSQHGSLVGKDELHREIWGNKIVSDDSLTHCLLDIRKAIGDVNKTIIRTMPRRGYIFESPCQKENLEASDGATVATRPQTKKIIFLSSAILVTIAIAWLINTGRHIPPSEIQENSIAVLPFADRSEAQDQQFLANGLADEVINLLARSPDLLVIARTSSFSFGGKTPDIPTIRDALKVAYVLEGSVHRYQDQLTITAQLIDTTNSSNIWSASYKGRPQNRVALQKQIADAVLLTIAPDADDNVMTPAQRSFSADELMLLARFYEQEVRELPEVDELTLGKAIDLYRDAVQADPMSALAHSRLAGALLYAGDVRGAEVPVFRAEFLNPNLSEVQETLGKYYWLRGLPGAGAAWKRAIELNPNNADALSSYAFWYWMQANDDGPEELFRHALDLDPLSLARHAALGEFLAHQARVDKTKALIERIKRRFDSARSYRVIARLLELIGEVDTSIAWTIKASDREPGNPDHVSALAELYAEIGDFETALALEPEPGIGLLYKMGRYTELIDKAEILMIEEPGDLHLRYLLAFAYSATGFSDNAIRILRSVGQPNMQRSEIRQSIEIEGFVAYIDALDASGDGQQARELAEWFVSKRHTQSENWWVHVNRACSLAVLGNNDEALDSLERVTFSPRLPWDSAIRGSHCFEQYQDEPRYQAVLAQVDSRRAAIRQRLPTTLRAHVVDLQLATRR